MKKYIFTFLSVVFIISCKGDLGNSHDIIQVNNENFDEKDIVGTWKLDEFSYKYLFSYKYFDSISIIFNEDRTFKLNNSKDLFKTKSAESLTRDVVQSGIIDNQISEGKWEITRYENVVNQLTLFYKDNTNQSGLKVYKKGNEYQIWYFFGDPDTGERLRFLKEK